MNQAELFIPHIFRDLISVSAKILGSLKWWPAPKMSNFEPGAINFEVRVCSDESKYSFFQNQKVRFFGFFDFSGDLFLNFESFFYLIKTVF